MLPIALAIIVGVSGCAKPEPWQTEDAEEALEFHLSALYFGRTEYAWHGLMPEVQDILTARADALGNDGAGLGVKPEDLITSQGFVGPHQVKSYDAVKASGPDRAAFKVTTQFETTFDVAMQRIDGVWRVEGVAVSPASEAQKPLADPTWMKDTAVVPPIADTEPVIPPTSDTEPSKKAAPGAAPTIDDAAADKAPTAETP